MNTQTQGDRETGLASLLDGTTPGPWYADITQTSFGNTVLAPELAITFDDGFVLARVCPEGKRTVANARLIAAAPALAASHAALVAVCAEVVGAFDSPGVVLPDWEPLFAALAKARAALSDARKVQV